MSYMAFIYMNLLHKMLIEWFMYMEGILYKAYVCALQWIYADVGGLSNGKELGACLAMCVEHEAREASLRGKPTQALYWPPYLLLITVS